MFVNNLITNALWSTLSHVLQRGTLTICAIYLARNLNVDDFSAYNYFVVTVSTLSVYASLGLGATSTRYFSEVKGGEQDQGRLIGNLFGISFLFGLVIFLATLAVPRDWLLGNATGSQFIISVGVLVSVMVVVPGGGLIGLEKYKESCCVSFVSCIAMIVLTAISLKTKSVYVAMGGVVFSYILQSVGAGLVIIKEIGWNFVRKSFSFRRDNVLKIFNYAGPMFFVSILAGSTTWVVGRMVIESTGRLEFSAYSIGMQWFALGLLVPGMVSRVILPRMVRSDGRERGGIIRAGLTLSIGFSVLISVVGILASKKLILLYGEKYEDFYYLIDMALIMAALYSPINAIGSAVLARDGQYKWLSVHAWGMIIILMTAFIFAKINALTAMQIHLISISLMLPLVFYVGKQQGVLWTNDEKRIRR